jgi:CubicO group peptidase (beta-lactamase class C family)
VDALQPQITDQDEGTGWAWVTMPSPTDGRMITWHNGGTGGFTAFLGLDRERRVGVVILSARAENPNHVTRAGFRLLHDVGGCA